MMYNPKHQVQHVFKDKIVLNNRYVLKQCSCVTNKQVQCNLSDNYIYILYDRSYLWLRWVRHGL